MRHTTYEKNFLHFHFCSNQNSQIAPDKYFCGGNSRKLLSNTRRKLCSKPIIKKITFHIAMLQVKAMLNLYRFIFKLKKS